MNPKKINETYKGVDIKVFRVSQGEFYYALSVSRTVLESKEIYASIESCRTAAKRAINLISLRVEANQS